MIRSATPVFFHAVYYVLKVRGKRQFLDEHGVCTPDLSRAARFPSFGQALAARAKYSSLDLEVYDPVRARTALSWEPDQESLAENS